MAKIIRIKKSKDSHGLTLVEMCIAIAIALLLIGLAIPNIMRMRLLANDGIAQVNLRHIANALEGYFAENGSYPALVSELVKSNPAYINKDYFSGTYSGFIFDDNLGKINYTVTAIPLRMGQTGTKQYNISTGGILSEGNLNNQAVNTE